MVHSKIDSTDSIMDSIICADLCHNKGNFVVDFWIKEEIKMKYLYKYIKCYQYWGTWRADYDDGNGNKFPLHRWCCKTKANAYAIAKQQVDYLNGKEN